MSEKINRRTFIKESSAIGLGTLVGSAALPLLAKEKESENASGPADVSVVGGEDYFKNTVKAVEQLGGMSKFVPKGSTVAILANPQRNNPGAFTSPKVLAAVIRMCRQAGAKTVTCISWLPETNWTATGLKEAVDKEGAVLKITDLKDETQFKSVPIPMGKSLKEARLMKEYFNHDLLITVPITKDHAGNKFTGTLKNMMGINSPQSNRTFHKPNWQTDINDIKHLDQCIADLNTVIKPALCIVDATEFIVTNGPFGPGKLLKLQKVVAGTDRVAVDAYCSTLWGLNPQDIFTITAAHEHKLGNIELNALKILNMTI